VANLVNFGIVPLTFANVEDYEKIRQGDNISLDVSDLEGDLFIDADGEKIPVVPAFEAKDVPILKAGGALPFFNLTH
jgi:aconitate hydratase